ncbi:predicted protein, partial [Naegleria gruberi]
MSSTKTIGYTEEIDTNPIMDCVENCFPIINNGMQSVQEYLNEMDKHVSKLGKETRADYLQFKRDVVSMTTECEDVCASLKGIFDSLLSMIERYEQGIFDAQDCENAIDSQMKKLSDEFAKLENVKKLIDESTQKCSNISQEFYKYRKEFDKANVCKLLGSAVGLISSMALVGAGVSVVSLGLYIAFNPGVNIPIVSQAFGALTVQHGIGMVSAGTTAVVASATVLVVSIIKMIEGTNDRTELPL